MRKLFLLVLVLAFMVPGIAQPSTTDNLVDGCVTDYDAAVDYFPNKVAFDYAENVLVDYFNNYKVVTVTGATATYDYVLVQCGTPAPEADDFPAGTQFIEVPAGNFVSLSTTQLPSLVALDLLDVLVGMDSFLYANTPEVRELIDAGELVEVSPNFELNFEQLLITEPSIVMTDDFSLDRLAALAEAEIFTAVNTDYLETTPLGRAEWLKYTALFYNAETAAEAAFDEIETAYLDAVELAASVPEDEQPVVLWNAISPFSDSWGIPGSSTYAGRLIEDAGGSIALQEETDGSIAFLSFEAVYEGALEADIWVTNLFAIAGLEDVLAIDERYADFAAVENNQVWNNDLDVNENGGSNYYELGVTNPHLILQDLVAIFHPELLPDHEFNFFRRVEAAN
ncbi:MAG: ABC transporter substrate-binding protein [Anaerolineae bacterium]